MLIQVRSKPVSESGAESLAWRDQKRWFPNAIMSSPIVLKVHVMRYDKNSRPYQPYLLICFHKLLDRVASFLDGGAQAEYSVYKF